MFCSNCGQKTPRKSKYCPNCGNEIKYSLFQRLFSNKKWAAVAISFFMIIILSVVLVIILDNSTGDTPNTINVNKDLSVPTITDFNASLISQISASVVSIFCPFADDEENGYWGSGTIWTDDGIIVTNSHVIPQTETELLTPDYGCLVTLPDPDTGVPIEMYYADPVVIPELSDDYDLAILEIYDVVVDEDGYTYGQYPNTFPAFDDTDLCVEEYIKLGEPVKIFGYPASSGNNSLTITEGVVSNFPDDARTILTSAKVDSGNSGGLAVDRYGCQLGIPTAVSIGEYENLGVIITSETVFEFINKYADLLESV